MDMVNFRYSARLLPSVLQQKGHSLTVMYGGCMLIYPREHNKKHGAFLQFLNIDKDKFDYKIKL